ncbi:MAG: hypothetical protein KJZ78_15880, partial [Bryobacteraceae bacterium]|nr:hypothetical protein [Bryobacteraceae bacterium]
MRSAIAVAATVAFWALGATEARGAAALAGHVVNENNAPVRGARIAVRLPPSENTLCEATSDAAG